MRGRLDLTRVEFAKGFDITEEGVELCGEPFGLFVGERQTGERRHPLHLDAIDACHRASLARDGTGEA